MSARRPDGFSLSAACRHPGFTPAKADVPELMQLLAADGEGELGPLVKALERVPAAAAAAVLELFPASTRPLRARLVDLAGRLLSGLPPPVPEGADVALRKAALLVLLIGSLHDQDIKVQINAANGLGRCKGEAAAANALTARLVELSTSGRREMQRATMRALAKVAAAGGPAAQAALASAEAKSSADAPLVARAQLIGAREASRDEASEVLAAAPLPPGLQITLHCRRGLEGFLAGEAESVGWPSVTAPGSVTLKGGGSAGTGPQSLANVYQLRLFEYLSLPLADLPLSPIPAAVTALKDAAKQQLLRLLTLGTVRYRIDWPKASRAELWELAQKLQDAVPEFVNDPTASTWELVLSVSKPGRTLVSLVPRRISDERFSYRSAYVYAASHPTIAAALARVAGAKGNDVVWDPFVGSGLELTERALIGPYTQLVGTDIDPGALTAAAANLAAAGVDLSRVRLELGDCRSFNAVRPSLIISNPPMGRRVHRGVLTPVIDGFVAHAATILALGGRLVWLSPLPERTAAQFAAAGLRVTLRQVVDMGGFDAELQRVEKAHS